MLSDKASKWNLQELEANISNTYAKLAAVQEIQDRYKSTLLEFENYNKETDNKFKQLNKMISQEIILAVKKFGRNAVN